MSNDTLLSPKLGFIADFSVRHYSRRGGSYTVTVHGTREEQGSCAPRLLVIEPLLKDGCAQRREPLRGQTTKPTSSNILSQICLLPSHDKNGDTIKGYQLYERYMPTSYRKKTATTSQKNSSRPK